MIDRPLTLAALGELCAADVMSAPVVTVHADDSLIAAWELFDRGRFRHLPVVGRDGRCVAVLEEAVVAMTLSTGAPFTRFRVADAMSVRGQCVLPETLLNSLARLMLRERVTAVAVVDPESRLLGIVTDTDLVGAIARLGGPASLSATG